MAEHSTKPTLTLFEGNTWPRDPARNETLC